MKATTKIYDAVSIGSELDYAALPVKVDLSGVSYKWATLHAKIQTGADAPSVIGTLITVKYAMSQFVLPTSSSSSSSSSGVTSSSSSSSSSSGVTSSSSSSSGVTLTSVDPVAETVAFQMSPASYDFKLNVGSESNVTTFHTSDLIPIVGDYMYVWINTQALGNPVTLSLDLVVHA